MLSQIRQITQINIIENLQDLLNLREFLINCSWLFLDKVFLK